MTTLKYNILLFLVIFAITCYVNTHQNNFLAFGQSSSSNLEYKIIDKEISYFHVSDKKENDTLLVYQFEPFLSVNGTDYVDITHNKTLSLKEFAIIFWFKTDQIEFFEPAHLVNRGGFNSDEKGENMNYGVWISEEGEIHGGFESKSGEDFIVQSSTKKYNDGKWHFVLLSYDGNLLRLDVDGKEVDRQNTEKVIPDTTGDQPLRIGANSLDKDKFFTGNIDEIRIYNKGLTKEEIRSIYEDNIFNKEDQIFYSNFGLNTEISNNDKSIPSNISDIVTKNKNDSLLSSKNVTSIENKEEKEPLISSPLTNEVVNTTKPTSFPIKTNDNITNKILPMSILENKTKEGNYFSIVTAGDFGCSMRAQENIKEMESLDPDLFLALGDYSYKKSPDCWFEMTKSLEKNIKIAIGNHEDKEESEGSDKLIQSYLDNYDLDNTYYSFDYKNLHVLVLNTQKELSIDLLRKNVISDDHEYYNEYVEIIKTNGNTEDLTEKLESNNDKEKKDEKIKNDEKKKVDQNSNKSLDIFIPEVSPDITLDELLKKHSFMNINVTKLDKRLTSDVLVPDIEVDPGQYEFAVNDLKKAANDPAIDWIFVMLHKPMYSTASKQFAEFLLREKYQPIFDQYNVDLVLQAHNHLYDRTLPIKYNSDNIVKPIILDQNNINNFIDPDGTIFSVIGTGGKGPHRLVDNPEYTVSQHLPIAGFLNIAIAGKQLEATYYDIGIKCEESISEKTGRTIFNLDVCEPRNESEPLKIIDRYYIIKE
ncbi:MAG: LamG-like jellyroll fold domain-containing protein [Nitrososphaeraceae archaeon]